LFHRRFAIVGGEATHCFSSFMLAERLKSACSMLTGSASRHFIVAQLGFGDVSHFNRAFKRHFGAKPSEFAGSFFANSPLVKGASLSVKAARRAVC
jgi:AraC-like DNA-binding protein